MHILVFPSDDVRSLAIGRLPAKCLPPRTLRFMTETCTKHVFALSMVGRQYVNTALELDVSAFIYLKLCRKYHTAHYLSTARSRALQLV